MRCIPEIDDTVSLKEFSFTNKHGGTGMSDSEWNEKFTGVASVRVIHAFYDYECGWRFWGTAVSDDLIQYMDRNTGKDKRVLFDEFEVITKDKV
jgi:hypothetical protein